MVLAALYFLLPVLIEQIREPEHAPKGMMNLHDIGVAIGEYNSDHSSEFPPDLQLLVEDGYVHDPDVFVDPSDENPQARGSRHYRYSYEYAGPLPKDTPSSFVVAYGRKGIHADGRLVLYVDGAVEFVPLPETKMQPRITGLVQSLHQQYQWLMKHHGSEYTDAQKAAFREFYEISEPAGEGH